MCRDHIYPEEAFELCGPIPDPEDDDLSTIDQDSDGAFDDIDDIAEFDQYNFDYDSGGEFDDVAFGKKKLNLKLLKIENEIKYILKIK